MQSFRRANKRGKTFKDKDGKSISKDEINELTNNITRPLIKAISKSGKIVYIRNPKDIKRVLFCLVNFVNLCL